MIDVLSDPWCIIAYVSIAGSWVMNGGLLDCQDWLRRKLGKSPKPRT